MTSHPSNNELNAYLSFFFFWLYSHSIPNPRLFTDTRIELDKRRILLQR